MRKEELKRHIIVILALNQVGALARIISVFGRRGFNIETITASPSNYPGLTRITIIITATDLVRFQTDAVISRIDLAVSYTYMLAVSNIDSIIVPECPVQDVEIGQCEILACVK